MTGKKVSVEEHFIASKDTGKVKTEFIADEPIKITRDFSGDVKVKHRSDAPGDFVPKEETYKITDKVSGVGEWVLGEDNILYADVRELNVLEFSERYPSDALLFRCLEEPLQDTVLILLPKWVFTLKGIEIQLVGGFYLDSRWGTEQSFEIAHSGARGFYWNPLSARLSNHYALVYSGDYYPPGNNTTEIDSINFQIGMKQLGEPLFTYVILVVKGGSIAEESVNAIESISTETEQLKQKVADIKKRLEDRIAASSEG